MSEHYSDISYLWSFHRWLYFALIFGVSLPFSLIIWPFLKCIITTVLNYWDSHIREPLIRICSEHTRCDKK